MAAHTHNRSGWSIGLYDLDNDGWKDVFTSNSHVNDTVEFFEAAKYKLVNSVFGNVAGTVFRDASAGSGLDRAEPRAHRGAGFADVNNDGLMDIYTVNGFATGSLERNYWYAIQEMVTQTKNQTTDARDWPVMGDRDLSGHERGRLFMQTIQRVEPAPFAQREGTGARRHEEGVPRFEKVAQQARDYGHVQRARDCAGGL